MAQTLEITTKRIVIKNLNDLAKQLAKLWLIDFLDSDDIKDISRIYLKKFGINPNRLEAFENTEFMPTLQDFLGQNDIDWSSQEYHEEERLYNTPCSYSTITQYIYDYQGSFDLQDLTNIYSLYLNWNGYHAK